ncbi:MAG: MFS transporter [Actinomycetota bacterium]
MLTRRLLPPGSSPDAAVLVQTRAVRALGDGLVSVVLAAHLTAIGLSEAEIGAVVTATMLGSAALTLLVGFRANAIRRRRLLQGLALVMVLTGLGFAVVTSFAVLLVIALLGTMNPSSGDVSAFLPTEQALLPSTAPDSERTSLFARYGLVGTLVAALGAALAGVPEWIAERVDTSASTALRWTFVGYAGLGLVALVRYRRLSDSIDSTGEHAGDERDGERSDDRRSGRSQPLGESRRTVYRLAALFSLDAFGGGFTVTAIIVLWLQNRHDLSTATSGAVFFWAGLLSAFSQLLAPRLAARIGLIRTMAFTHIPANVFLIAAALMPNAWSAIVCLLLRAALAQMDGPARNSYVMAMVAPHERPAAASVTAVPRSLIAAVPPLFAGWLLAATDFGWPLVIAGVVKILYDLILLAQFRDLRPPEERAASAAE